MVYRYYFFVSMLLFNTISYSMLVSLTKTGSISKRSALCKIQKRSCHVTRPIDSELISSITSLQSLEQTLRKDYLSAKEALIDRYVEEPKAFKSFEQAYRNYINTHSFLENHSNAERDIALPEELTVCADKCSQLLGINPQALSYKSEDLSTYGYAMTAQSPSIAVSTHASLEEVMKQKNGKPFAVSIIGFNKPEQPFSLTFHSELIHSMSHPQHRPLTLWFVLHELSHIRQHHHVFTDLLPHFNGITNTDDGHWYLDSARNSIASNNIDITQTKEYKDLQIQEERIADLLPFCMLKALATEVNHMLEKGTLIRGDNELYLNQKELHTLLSKVIVKGWKKEPTNVRPMPILHE